MPYRQIEGELKLLEKTGEFIFPVELWLLNDGVNRNNWQFINLEQHREKWAGIPILVAYVNGGRTVGDGHNQAEKFDPQTGEMYQSFTAATAERIVGATSENPDDIRLEERGGNTWVVAKGFLWAWYAHELVTKIAEDARQGRVMSLSIEALVTESRMEDGGVEVEEAYEPLGVTLLGDGVMPAVEDAHVAMLTQIESEFKELKLRAASYLAQSADKPQNPNPKGVEKRMRLSQKQLRELQPKFGDSYRVLAAEQYEDGSVTVCLLSFDEGTATYTMASVDESVVPDRIVRVNAQVHFCEDGREDICVDATDMTECAAEDARECKERAEAAEKELKDCKATIEQMVSAENARRLSAAKAKATATLEAFNACREDKVDVKALEALNKDIEAGKFTALSDENGAWIGERAVEEKVLSLCAAAVMELDRKNAKRTSEMTWGNVKKASAAPGTVGELFASKN